MSIKHTNPRFFYSASAFAVSATLRRPVHDYLTDQTNVVLAPTGGFAQQNKSETNFRDIVRTGRVSTTVVGNEDDADWTTVATVTVENLDILGFVRADAIVGRIASRYPKHSTREKDAYERRMHPSTFFFTGSAFYGLRINGEAIHPTLRDEPVVTERDDLPIGFDRESLGYRFANNDTYPPIQIFKNVQPSYPFEEFGTVYLGDVDAFRGKVTLVMLRVVLGCTVDGGVNVCGQSSNGHRP